MTTSGMSMIRVNDKVNPFIDCVVIVPADCRTRAVHSVQAAMQKYRTYEYDTYVEAINALLLAENIPHSVIRRPWNGDYDRSDLVDEIWEDMIAGINCDLVQ